MEVTKSLWTLVSSILWGAGALFAVSLALTVSGATVLVMMCLLMLADLSENWGGDASRQVLPLSGETAQIMNREFSCLTRTQIYVGCQTRFFMAQIWAMAVSATGTFPCTQLMTEQCRLRGVREVRAVNGTSPVRGAQR